MSRRWWWYFNDTMGKAFINSTHWDLQTSFPMWSLTDPDSMYWEIPNKNLKVAKSSVEEVTPQIRIQDCNLHAWTALRNASQSTLFCSPTLLLSNWSAKEERYHDYRVHSFILQWEMIFAWVELWHCLKYLTKNDDFLQCLAVEAQKRKTVNIWRCWPPCFFTISMWRSYYGQRIQRSFFRMLVS